jgi:TPR repeat protein
LLAQAAAGVDHALSLGLTGLEFGLHQVYLHFPQAIEKEKILQESVGAWPAFDLKLYPLGATRDIATSQTWAGGQTMVGGATASHMEGADARPRYIQALAAIIYEVLGGTLSPLVLRGAGGPTMRYTPLSTLSEEGNEVLKQALDPSRSFASAGEFSAALGRLDGLQVSRREVKPPAPTPRAAASRAPLAPEKSAAPQTPAFVPSQPRKPPLVLIGGAAALIVACVAAVFFLQKPKDPISDLPDPNASPAPVADVNESPAKTQPSVAVVDTPPPATPVPSTPMPATPPPPPTRQELVKAATNKAQEFEDKGDWENSLSAWLHVAKDYPEFAVGRNHLETLLEPLRKRPNPLSPKEFLDMRAMITEAAQYGVLAAMMLLADNVREQEPQQAFEWYTTASSKGYAPAMTQLGLMYSNSTLPGTPDLVKAVQFLQAAADKGDSAGKAALGECYLKGKGVEKDEKRGLELYREAVAAGDVRATNNLGDALNRRGTEAVKNGQSGAADFAEAFELFTKASERGSLEALGNLAVLHLKGQGVPAPDQKKAAKLFEKGARGGNAFCMWGYASCLELGIGLDPNLLQAKSWYRKAAEAGDKKAVEWCRENSVTFTPK